MRNDRFILLALVLAVMPAWAAAQTRPATPASRPATAPATREAPPATTRPATTSDGRGAAVAPSPGQPGVNGSGLGPAAVGNGTPVWPPPIPLGGATSPLRLSADPTFVPMSSLDLGNSPDLSGQNPSVPALAPSSAITPALPGSDVTVRHPGIGPEDSSQPGAVEPGAATQPSAASRPAPAAAMTDPIVHKAAAQFSAAEYRKCIETLADVVDTGNPSMAARHLYIASLVATDKLSTAAYEAVRAARADPKAFLTDPTLGGLCRTNPDFAKHFQAVRDVGEKATGLEPGLLWALYQHLSTGRDSDAAVTLTLLRVPPEDRAWYTTLLASVRPRTAIERGRARALAARDICVQNTATPTA